MMSVPEVRVTDGPHDVYEDGSPSPYVKYIICKDYATDFCFDECKRRSIGCAGDFTEGKK